MKNYDEFEKKLQETDRIPAPQPGQAESGLLKLRLDLKQACQENRPSDFEQSTAWTRLESRLEPRPASSVGRLIYYVATAGAAVALTAMFFMSRGSTGSEGLPRISEAKPGIYVTPFYSEEAKADVIWAEGYQYIPANYTY